MKSVNNFEKGEKMWNGVYFTIGSKSENDVDAISEAYRLAQVDDVGSVEVHRCGTQGLIAHVFAGDGVGGLDSNSIADEESNDEAESARAFNDARRETAQRETDRREARNPAGRRLEFQGEFIQPGVKLTIAQRKQSYYGFTFGGFTVVDRRGVDLGQNVYLAVIRRESDGQLFGVPWGDLGESITIGNYSEEDINAKLPIIPLWARTKSVTVYEGAGRSLLSELDVQL